MDLFADDPILPDDPEGLDVLHDREYRVRAYKRSDELLLIRGAVRDQKPPGLYLSDDPDPLTIHHMQVELDVAFPSLEITRAEVLFETHPNEECPRIAPHYAGLVGLSIARGFTHKVRELFGGPRGCTHTTALLQAMAPVAVQCAWSMRMSAFRASDGDRPAAATPEQARSMWRLNLNTCHVWDEDGSFVADIKAGTAVGVPLFMRDRLRSRGVEPDEWQSPMRG